MPNVWNLLPIASCLWNDVILFWYIPLSLDVDWSPFLFDFPFGLPHIFYWLRDCARWAVLELAALRPVLPSERAGPISSFEYSLSDVALASQCLTHGLCSSAARALPPSIIQC